MKVRHEGACGGWGWWFKSMQRRLVKTMMDGRECTHQIPAYISCGCKARQGEVSGASSLASGQSMSQYL